MKFSQHDKVTYVTPDSRRVAAQVVKAELTTGRYVLKVTATKDTAYRRGARIYTNAVAVKAR